MTREQVLRGAVLVVLLPLIVNIAAAWIYDQLKLNLAGVGDLLRSPLFALIAYVVLALTWLLYWARVAPRVATAAENAALRDKLLVYEAELASQHLNERKAAVLQMINEAEGLETDYSGPNRPHTASNALTGTAWGRVEQWEKRIRQVLPSDMANEVLDGDISLAPVMDQPWYARIGYHVGVRRSRLQAILENPKWWIG